MQPETNHRVLIKRKVRRYRKENEQDVRSCYEQLDVQDTPRKTLLKGITRPLKMMFLSPILIALSTQVAFNCEYIQIV